MVDSIEEVVPDPPDQPADGQAADGQASGDGQTKRKSGISRRSFVGRSSLGVAAAGIVGTFPALPSWLAGSAPEASGAAGDASVATNETTSAEQAIVAQVHNVNTGEISLHINGTTVAVRDQQLARSIARALP